MVLDYLGIEKVPLSILQPYASMFKECEIVPASSAQLRTLLRLAVKVKADMAWVTKLPNPMGILIDNTWLGTDR